MGQWRANTSLPLSYFLWCRIIYLGAVFHLFGEGGTCADGGQRSEESLRFYFPGTIHFLFSWDPVSQASSLGSLRALSPSSQIQSAHHHTQLDSRNQNQIPKLSREAFCHLHYHHSTWIPFLQTVFSMIFQNGIISIILSPLECLLLFIMEGPKVITYKYKPTWLLGVWTQDLLAMQQAPLYTEPSFQASLWFLHSSQPC